MIKFKFSQKTVNQVGNFLALHTEKLLVLALTVTSVLTFLFYYNNKLGLAYNDARSHLDIGRRVVEGLKPGLAQLGSVWLPLPHILMIPTIWNDFFWHSGLAGALQSMIAFVACGYLIFAFLKRLGVGMLGRLVGVAIFVLNINILYMQSTAMTELLLLGVMTAAVYELYKWQETNNMFYFITSSFWIMLSTLTRYDGWFLLFYITCVLVIITLKNKGYKATEGTTLMFVTLAGFGVVLWLLWNLVIFKDPLYFAFGPYSAHSQQVQLEDAGVLATKKNLFFSLKVYWYALSFNSNTFIVLLGLLGAGLLFISRKLSFEKKLVISALFAPFLFNIIALFLGHSVLFVQGLSGDTWFNVRYGLMMMPSIAIFVGFLVDRLTRVRYMVIGLLAFTIFFSFISYDAVTIDDARVGSSQKNVSEVSNWLAKNAASKEGFILISAASHDAIIFSSGLPMKRFIHEGTGAYWEDATTSPDSWARWIIMRTNDLADSTFRLTHKSPGFKNYTLVGHYPFADIYEIKPEYVKRLHTEEIYTGQK